MAETYAGVKFRTKFIAKEIPKDKRIEKLKKWCRIFSKKGFSPPYGTGSAGNLSFRIKKNTHSFVITAANTKLDKKTKDEDFVIVKSVNMKKKIVFCIGMKKPSSESILHYLIYKSRKDANSVLHAHCRKISKNAAKLKIIETKKEYPYGTVKLAKSVLEIIENEKFIEMKNHGFVSLGKNIDEAGNLALRLYQKC